MCCRAATKVTSNRAILATLTPYVIILTLPQLHPCCQSSVAQQCCHCRSCIVAVLPIKVHHQCHHCWLSRCCWAVDQCSSLMLSLALSLCCPYPYHGQIVAIASSLSTDVAGMKNKHCSQGLSCSLSFLSSDGSSYLDHSCNALLHKHLPILTLFVRQKV